jgi:hypothetical protein
MYGLKKINQLFLIIMLGIIISLALGQVGIGVTATNCTEIKGEVQDARIHEIQGASHQSPLLCYRVMKVPGVVTYVLKDGFYMQDPEPDNNNSTPEGIFVFTKVQPNVGEGDNTLVNGVVKEYWYGSNDLSMTEIVADKNPEPNSSASASITPKVIGIGGQVPPDKIIEDDAKGDLNARSTYIFDPDSDGLDFYETLEGMLVQINDPVIIGLPDSFRAGQDVYWYAPVVGDNGTKASIMSNRSSMVASKGDFNPERIIAGFKSQNFTANVGDRFEEPITGIMVFRGNNYWVETRNVPKIKHMNITQEMSRDAQPDELTIATFNVLNLNITQGEFGKLAHQIVDNLRSPDILGLQEIEDNNGEISDTVVNANVTFEYLVNNISAIGGPEYKFFDIDPERLQDGGVKGGNIRVGFLFRTDRGISFSPVSGGNATNPVNLTNDETGVHLSFNPGRINPMNYSFKDSRKPLAAEFQFDGQKLFLIANHFNSKNGDKPLYGRYQPPINASEKIRHVQAQIVHDFVARILEYEPDANVVVLGDLNDFQFSRTLEILKGDILFNTIDLLPPNDQYTINYEGNSEVFDQILVSRNLLNKSLEPDIVHTNSGFAEGVSDHDPVLIRVSFS